MKKQKIVFLIIVSLFTTISLAGNKHAFNTGLSIDADNAKDIVIDVGSGSLEIRGGNVDEIIVSAKVYSKKYSSLDDLQEAFDSKMIFTLESIGSKVVLKVLNKEQFFSFGGPEIAVDLDITIPKNLDVEIDDGSGSIYVSDIDGELEIDDGSGSTSIHNIGNDVTIDDGSGNLEITNVQGNVDVDDGSGNQNISNITGNVFIDDGSGTVNIKQVSGNVTIDDGSGSINVNELAGNFKLIDGGSGSIQVNGERWVED